MSTQIEGLDKVLENLNKEMKQIRGRSMKGLIRAAMLVHRSMEYNEPKIPVDTSTLRSSFFTEPFWVGENPAVRLGFTAHYAWKVHEMYGAHFQRPGAGAGFFKAALGREQDGMIDEVRKNAKV